MAKNDGGPAFPHPQGWRRHPEVSDCMSLRDWFAGMAMPDIISAVSRGEYTLDAAPDGATAAQAIAIDAYVLADAMIFARGYGEPK